MLITKICINYFRGNIYVDSYRLLKNPPRINEMGPSLIKLTPRCGIALSSKSGERHLCRHAAHGRGLQVW